ncbi:hypothetical protein BHE90_017176, partial [Fusarium euwallaceae]
MTTILNTRSPQMPSIGTLHWPKGCCDVPDPNDQGLHDDRDYDCGDDSPSNGLSPTMEFFMSPPRSTSMKPVAARSCESSGDPAGKELPLQSVQEPQKQSGLQPPPPSPAESLSSI